MNLIDLLLKPIKSILSRAVDVNVDEKKSGALILHLLGPKSDDETTVEMLDQAIVGGAAIEAIDGPIGRIYLKKIRRWAEKLAGGTFVPVAHRQGAGFDKIQFKDLIERTLKETDPDLCSEVAVALLLGTAAQESRFGTFLRQLQGGPALGAFQMEPATFDWLRDRYSGRYDLYGRRVEELEWDLRFAIVMARLRYRVMPEPLPDTIDLRDLGGYWKRHYNTVHGRGTVEEFIANYKKYVG